MYGLCYIVHEAALAGRYEKSKKHLNSRNNNNRVFVRRLRPDRASESA